jgi:hypothetical protein
MLGVIDWLRDGDVARMRGLPPAPDCAAVPVAALFAFAGMEDAGVATGGELQSLTAFADTEDAEVDAGELAEAGC